MNKLFQDDKYYRQGGYEGLTFEESHADLLFPHGHVLRLFVVFLIQSLHIVPTVGSALI